MNNTTTIRRLSGLLLTALLLSAPATGTTLREAQYARRAAYDENRAKHEERKADAKLQQAVKKHAAWRKHIRALHKDLRLFYGRTGSDRLFLCDEEGKTQKLSEEDFVMSALETELRDNPDDDFSPAHPAEDDILITEVYPYTLHFRCRRVLEVTPERIRLLAAPVEGELGRGRLYMAELIILHPTPEQMEMDTGDSIREYFSRAVNEDGTPARSVSYSGSYPVLKTYNTLKDDTRCPNTPPQKKRR